MLRPQGTYARVGQRGRSEMLQLAHRVGPGSGGTAGCSLACSCLAAFCFGCHCGAGAGSAFLTFSSRFRTSCTCAAGMHATRAVTCRQNW